MFGRTYRNCVKAEGMDEEEITEQDPRKVKRKTKET